MMESSAEHLSQRRRELLARCAEQRSSLHIQMDRWRKSLSMHDAVYAGLDYAKRYQLWIVGAAIAIVVIKPRRIKAALQTGTAALATWKSVAPFVQTAQRYFWQDKTPRRLQS